MGIEIAGVRIDPRAVVEEGADVGSGTAIWHFSHVRSGAIIGENCIIGKGSYVDEGVIIGNDCKLQNGSMLYLQINSCILLFQNHLIL